MLLGVHGDQDVADAEWDGVAFEEVGHVDEVLAGFGVGVGDEFVVDEAVGEDIGVEDDDRAGVGAVAGDVGLEAVEGLDGAFGFADVNRALWW